MGMPPLRARKSGTVVRRVLTGSSNTDTPQWLRRLCAVPGRARGPGCGMDRRYPAWREAIPPSPYTKPKIRLRKGFSMARRRPRPALGITRTGPPWTMWKTPYAVMGKGLSWVPIVENLGDGYGNVGTGPRIAQPNAQRASIGKQLKSIFQGGRLRPPTSVERAAAWLLIGF